MRCLGCHRSTTRAFCSVCTRRLRGPVRANPTWPQTIWQVRSQCRSLGWDACKDVFPASNPYATYIFRAIGLDHCQQVLSWLPFFLSDHVEEMTALDMILLENFRENTMGILMSWDQETEAHRREHHHAKLMFAIRVGPPIQRVSDLDDNDLFRVTRNQPDARTGFSVQPRGWILVAQHGEVFSLMDRPGEDTVKDADPHRFHPYQSDKDLDFHMHALAPLAISAGGDGTYLIATRVLHAKDRATP